MYIMINKIVSTCEQYLTWSVTNYTAMKYNKCYTEKDFDEVREPKVNIYT